MSYHREPRTLDERVADLDARLREVQTTVAVQLSADSLSALATQKGDILVATGPGSLEPLHVGSDGEVLVVDDAAPAGVAWSTEQTADDALMLGWLGL